MKSLLDLSISAVIALIFTLVLIPISRRLATRIGLLDKPNARKVHHNPTPLTGGIVIAISTFLAILLLPGWMNFVREYGILLGSSLVILIIGILDDRLDVKPIYRLMVQMACAYAVASSGIRITSFYGVFGLETLPVFLQYAFTILVISGVVNAFNLMDGIDGLASGLALTGFVVFAILAWHLQLFAFAGLFACMGAALVGFLRHNLSKRKIFLGDGGSLMLGFLLVSSGIYLLEKAQDHPHFPGGLAVVVVIGIFLLPVLDSLRVYRGRIKNGVSPFHADKSHIHHLFLLLGLDHKKSSMAINLLNLLLLVVLLIFYSSFSVTVVLVLATLLFLSVAGILTLNSKVLTWSRRIRELEEG